MRVITGSARGTTLKTPEGMLTRPTTERVKEAVFSSIHYLLPGRKVLDLFSGTGQMGIEALSRGAERCVFVDLRREAAELIRENLRRAKLEEQARQQADAQFENALVEAVVKESKMDIPDAMIERKLDEKIQDLALRMAYQGMRFEDFLKYTGQTEAQVRDQFRDEATNVVKGELVL